MFPERAASPVRVVVDCVTVIVKVAGVVTPLTLAVTVTVPLADAARVTMVDAWPLVPVVLVVELSVAAPDGETLQVTVTPASGLLFMSVTSATSGLLSCEPAVPVCVLPLTTVTAAGVTAVAVALNGPG